MSVRYGCMRICGNPLLGTSATRSNFRPALRCSLPTFQCSAWRSVLVESSTPNPCAARACGDGSHQTLQFEEIENAERRFELR
jgi:hypothetical protein